MESAVSYNSAQEFVEDYINGNVVDVDFSTDTLYWNIWTQTPASGPIGIGITTGGGRAWEITTATSGSYKLIHFHRLWNFSGETFDGYLAVNIASPLTEISTPECVGGSVPEQTFQVYSEAYYYQNSSTGINNGEYTVPGPLGCAYPVVFYGTGTFDNGIFTPNDVPTDQQFPNVLLTREETDGKIRTFIFRMP